MKLESTGATAQKPFISLEQELKRIDAELYEIVGSLEEQLFKLSGRRTSSGDSCDELMKEPITFHDSAELYLKSINRTKNRLFEVNDLIMSLY